MLTSEKYSDVEIMKRLRSRDNEVVKYIYTRYSPMIRLMINRLGGSKEDAEDIFQDGLIALTVLVDDRDFKLRHGLRTLFYKICKNQWILNLSKMSSARNYFVRKIDDSVDHDFSENYDNEICQTIFWEAFNGLDKDCRTILRLVWRGIPLKEIAEIIGNKYGYVRNRKCDCNNELVDKIKCHPTIKCITRTEKYKPIPG